MLDFYPKAQRGADGVNYGENGSNGSPGFPAFNMTIDAKSIMKESGKQLIFISQGGSGGDGGNGREGKSNMDKIPAEPTNPQQAYDQGKPDPNKPPTDSTSGHDCCCVWGKFVYLKK
jgi:hypothetical protein